MAMEKNKNRGGMFSRLPDEVITHILSFMDTPTAAKTSILCKRFTPLWHFIPSLTLPLYPYPHPFSYDANLVEFLGLVSDLIGAISKRNNTTLRKFCLRFDNRRDFAGGDECSICFRKLMRCAFERCSGELELSYSLSFPSLDTMLSSAAPTSLTSLKLIGCWLQRLPDLIAGCPLLRDLSLVRCVLNRSEFRISATQLRALVFYECDNGIDFYHKAPHPIHMEAKNLRTFSYNMCPNYNVVFTESPDPLKLSTLKGTFETCWLEATIPKLVALESLSIRSQKPCINAVTVSSPSLKSLELISYSNVTLDCPMLTALTLEKSHISSSSTLYFRSITSLVLRNLDRMPKWLDSHLAKCKLLRHLKLISCTLADKINISHKKLESLDIWDCLDMVEAHIDTPRLRCFIHSGPPLTFKTFNHSTSLEVTLHIKNEAHETTLCFSRMRPFLESYKSCKVLTVIAPVVEGSIGQHCYELFQAEVLVLRVGPRKSYKVLVESLLWMCCHPKFIKIVLESEVKSIEFKYNGALLLKDRHSVCLKSRRIIRCWTHGLESVTLTNITSEELNLRQFLKNCKKLDVEIIVMN